MSNSGELTWSAGLERLQSEMHLAVKVQREVTAAVGGQHVLDELRRREEVRQSLGDNFVVQLFEEQAQRDEAMAAAASRLNSQQPAAPPAPAPAVVSHLLPDVLTPPARPTIAPARAAVLHLGKKQESPIHSSDGPPCDRIETARERRDRAMVRLKEVGALKGARQLVAREFGVNVRTVGEWITITARETADEKKRSAMDAQLRGLVA